MQSFGRREEWISKQRNGAGARQVCLPSLTQPVLQGLLAPARVRLDVTQIGLTECVHNSLWFRGALEKALAAHIARTK